MREFRGHYVDLVAFASKEDLILHGFIENLTRDGRVEKLKDIFLKTANNCLVQEAEKVLDWLFWAVDDCCADPFMEHGIIGPHLGADHDQAAQIQQESKRRKAFLAMELYPQIPVYGVGQETVFPKIKKTLLRVIADWWRETPDEAESDRILLKFVDWASGELGVSGNDLIIDDIIRAASHDGFPFGRLTRQILLLSCFGQDLGILPSAGSDKILKSLLLGRARLIRQSHVHREMEVLCSLLGAGDDVYELATVLAAQASALGVKATKLGASLQDAGFSTTYQGTVTVAISDLKSVNVSIVRKIPSDEEADQEECLGRFIAAEDCVKKWRESNRSIRVTLSLEVRKFLRNGGLSDPVYSHEETF